MQEIAHKRGDTFIPTCTFKDKTGVAADYVALGITIKSQIRTVSGVLVANLTVTPGVGVGVFVLESPSTENWPTGSLRWDIQFLQGSHIFSTVTAAINVADDVTV
jgi:hypothetical protein